MGKIRVAFDAKRYFKNTTGLGNYARWLVDGIGQHEVEPILAIAEQTDTEYEQINASGFFARTFPSYWRSKGIVKALKSNNIDLWHGLSNELPFGIHRSGIPSVVTIHDLIQKRFPENYRWIDRSIYNAKLRYAQKRADAIITPSLQTKKDLISFYGTNEEKIHVIGIGIEKKGVLQSQVTKGDYVLCVSSFTRRKNLIRLIKAFDAVELKGVPLIIAGKGGESLGRARKMAESRSNIELKTDVSKNELSALYTGARFCVYPSLFEGYGIPVIEAFEHGKTLALSKISSLPEVAGEAAAYFNPRDIDQMSDAIKNLWFSDKYRLHLESMIPAELEKLDSHLLQKRIAEVYKSLI